MPFKEEITFFAKTNFRNEAQKFGIKDKDRRCHFYVIGRTGMGKTTLLENLIISDIYSNKGLALIDPHGDFALKILDSIPSWRVNDVVYFNPADIEHPFAFNLLENVNPDHKHLVASSLISVFKKIWADSWGPRLEHILRNSILALLEYPGSTLLGIIKLLTHEEFRVQVVNPLKDPVVRAFWQQEFASYPPRLKEEAISPVLNKVGQFLTTSPVRNIVAQTKSSMDLGQLMDRQKILVLNLSKSQMGEDASSLLGAMMITKLQIAAMQRATLSEEERKDFYVYVDEAHNFATDSFADILSEARKYHLCLTLAHQYINQLDEKVKDAIFGNVGTLVSFRVGIEDALFLGKEFAPTFTQQDLVNLPAYHIYLKLMIDGATSAPFSALTLPPAPLSFKQDQREKIIKNCRNWYTKPRQMVEDKIEKWLKGK